jgi:hypothetical protein
MNRNLVGWVSRPVQNRRIHMDGPGGRSCFVETLSLTVNQRSQFNHDRQPVAPLVGNLLSVSTTDRQQATDLRQLLLNSIVQYCRSNLVPNRSLRSRYASHTRFPHVPSYDYEKNNILVSK